MTYLGLDVGTSGVKAVLLDQGDQGQAVLAQGHSSLSVQRPHPGWSEQNPDDWLAACKLAIDAVRRAAPQAFAALRGIGVSGQMHGACLLDSADRPLRPAILWNDTRSATQCAVLEARADFRAIGGNIVMAGFTAPKLVWVAQHEPQLFAKTAWVLLPKDYVGLWLTGRHCSEMSDASGTLWLDVARRDWSDALLAATGMTRAQMPELVEGQTPAGTLRASLAQDWGLDPARRVVVAGGAGDNAATACAMGVSGPGTGFVSLGTSGVLFAATDHFAANTARAVHSFCHALAGRWHQMGVMLSAADSLNWLAEVTDTSAHALAALVDAAPGARREADGPGEIIFLPYLSGERTPHNAPDASALLLGLRRSHQLGELVRAVMVGVAFGLEDCRQALSDGGAALDQVWVAGGGSGSRAWLEILADATGLVLKIPNSAEHGAALGAGRLAIAASQADTSPGALTPDTMQALFASPVERAAVHPNPSRRAAYQDQHKRFRAAFEAVRSLG